MIIESSRKSQVTSHKSLAKKICDRKFGVGADGLIVLEKSKVTDVQMRIFNADGTEAEMCGNGARCVALYISNQKPVTRNQIRIEAMAGIIESQVIADKVKIKLTKPKNIKLGIPIKVKNRLLKVNFINTGVPHAVIFVEGLEKIDVVDIGRQIRYHKQFGSSGTNVDFVEVLNDSSLRVRTYERGVEDETLACGTGVAASAIVYRLQSQVASQKEKINVWTQGTETLKVYFKKDNDRISDVWLEGKARIVCKGEYYV